MNNADDFCGYSDEDEELVMGDDDDDEGWQDQEEDDMPPRRCPEIWVSNGDCPVVVVPILQMPKC